MQRVFWSVALSLAAACGGARGSGSLTAPGPVNEAAAGPCGRWVVGAEAMVRSTSTLILDGGQGTVEGPRFLGELACQVARHRPVALALAWPRHLTAAANLMVAGSENAEAKLRGDSLWTAESAPSTGLATVAMWELLTQLQVWRRAGVNIKVVTYGADVSDDPEAYQPDESSEMYSQVERLSEERRRSADTVLLLWVARGQGSLHGRGGDDASLASALESAGTKALSFQLEEPTADPGPANAPWSLERRTGLAGYDGVFRLGAPRSSGPLVNKEPPAYPTAR